MPDTIAVLADIAIGKILYAKIINKLKNQGDIQKIIVKAITFSTQHQLHLPVNAEQVKRFDNKIGY